MKLTPIASNMTELTIDGTRILFSYQTPVAAILLNVVTSQREFLKTDKKWSITTTKHINKYAGSNGFSETKVRSQEFFDNLVKYRRLNKGEYTPEDCANTTLIAAAPELLEAAIEALDEIIEHNIKLSDCFEGIKALKLRAAIGKAEGK